MSENNQTQATDVPQEKPSSHLAIAILATIFCFLPFGIVAIVKAANVDKLWFSGQHREAWEASKSARNWTIWAAVTTFAVIVGVYGTLAIIGSHAYTEHMTSADRQIAQANLQSVHQMLSQFKTEYGSYPCDATAEQLQELKPDVRFGELTGDYSNCYFRQLFYSSSIDTERPFYAKLSVAGKATKEADERFANGAALSCGENGMAYVLHKSTDLSGGKEAVNKNNAPLAFCSVYPANSPYSGGNIAFDMTSFTGHALVLYADGTVKDLKDAMEQDPTNEEKGTIKAGTEVFPYTRKGRDTADDYLVLPPELYTLPQENDKAKVLIIPA